jgi:hypothetical protein
MKTIKPKAIKKVTPKKAVAQPKLSKKDPDFYRKIGLISVKRRALSSEDYSEMAKASHVNRTEYHGGRKKKVVEGTDGTAVVK